MAAFSGLNELMAMQSYDQCAVRAGCSFICLEGREKEVRMDMQQRHAMHPFPLLCCQYRWVFAQEARCVIGRLRINFPPSGANPIHPFCKHQQTTEPLQCRSCF